MRYYLPNYNILHFYYTNSILTAYDNDLYDANFQESFPNRGKQFYITNDKTKGFRRFRLKLETQSAYIFSSEDNILCFVFKQSTTNTVVQH